MVQAIRPLNGRYLTVLDAEKHAVLDYDVHKAPTRVVSIENTNSGTVIPLEELQRLYACESSQLPCTEITKVPNRAWKWVPSGITTCRDGHDVI